MKKIFLVLLFTMMFGLCTCYATEQQTYKPLEPLIPAYVAADELISNLSISDGTASYYTKVSPQTPTSITKVTGTIRLINSKGTVIKTKTATVTLVNGYFKITDSKQLSAKGTYHVESTLKIYKGTKLVETLTSKSRYVTY